MVIFYRQRINRHYNKKEHCAASHNNNCSLSGKGATNPEPDGSRTRKNVYGKYKNLRRNKRTMKERYREEIKKMIEGMASEKRLQQIWTITKRLSESENRENKAE